MPAISHIYGLHPWHFGGEEVLTFAEIDAYAADLKSRARASQNTTRPSRRRR
jgi:hypothetical protein